MNIKYEIDLLLEDDTSQDPNNKSKGGGLLMGIGGAAVIAGEEYSKPPNIPQNREELKKLWNSKWSQEEKERASTEIVNKSNSKSASLGNQINEINKNNPNAVAKLDTKSGAEINLNSSEINNNAEGLRHLKNFDASQANILTKQKAIDEYYDKNPNLIHSIQQHLTPGNGLMAAGGLAAAYGAKKLWDKYKK